MAMVISGTKWMLGLPKRHVYERHVSESYDDEAYWNPEKDSGSP